MPKIPRQLRMVRAAAGLTRADVAKALEVDDRTVRNWESGGSDITLRNALRLCELYDCNIGELSGDLDYQLQMHRIELVNAQLKEILEQLGKRGPQDQTSP